MNETPLFYRKTLSLCCVLLVLTLMAALLCINRAFLDTQLLPAPQSDLPWQALANTDRDQGGSSTLEVRETTYSLEYVFKVGSGAPYPYASLALLFNPAEAPDALVDLSRHKELTFSVQCTPRNVLSLTLYTRDGKIDEMADPLAYRLPTTFFSCDENWREVVIDLRHLEVPDWWLRYHNLPLSDREYRLEEVSRIAFGNSAQSPTDTLSQVKIAEMRIRGENWLYLVLFGAAALLVWIVFGFWVFKQHTRMLIAELQQKVRQDRPLVAYQQLSIEPHKDKEKQNLLRYLATGYSNPDLNLEMVISATGINRAKINSILKEEIGLTFSAYLNKLRLTEAARLLSEQTEIGISEIAYSVGYNNVTYFNKLFKSEYGCSPKTFRTLYRKASAADDTSNL
jgi:AraC-like DNA-binding protein